MEAIPITGGSMGEYLEILKEENVPEKLQTLRQKLYQKAKNERSQRPFRPVPGMTYYDCLQHLGLQLL